MNLTIIDLVLWPNAKWKKKMILMMMGKDLAISVLEIFIHSFHYLSRYI